MITMFLALAILSLHSKTSCHSRRRLHNLKVKILKVKKKKIVLTVILKPLKPYLQRDILKAKESIEERFL